jgi:hypothetical protein
MATAEKPIYTSASCDNCDYVSATGSSSILPFAQEHADFHDHHVIANAYDGDGRLINNIEIIPAPRPAGRRPAAHIKNSSAWITGQ